MKCPACGNEERPAPTRCARCGRLYVFGRLDTMRDGRFTALLRAAAANDTYHFTRNQLFATYVRRWPDSGPMPYIIALVILVGMIGVAAYYLPDPVLMTKAGLGGAVASAGVLLFLGMWWAQRPPTRANLDEWLDRWLDAERVPKLVTGGALAEPPTAWAEDDVHDYGAERVLIVDDPDVVDCLVLNGFHAQERTLIIAANGYPAYVKPLVQRVLTTQPDVPVFLLHDSSPLGAALDLVAADAGIDVSRHEVFDLGWSHGEVVQLRRLAAFRPARVSNPMPIDVLPPKLLLGVLAAAMAHRVRVAALMGTGGDEKLDTVLAESHFG